MRGAQVAILVATLTGAKPSRRAASDHPPADRAPWFLHRSVSCRPKSLKHLEIKASSRNQAEDVTACGLLYSPKVLRMSRRRGRF